MKKSYKAKFLYITKLKKDLLFRNIDFFDYTYYKNITDNQCEYIDGTHSGDIINSRILLNLSDYNDNLKKIINFTNTKESINIASVKPPMQNFLRGLKK